RHTTRRAAPSNWYATCSRSAGASKSGRVSGRAGVCIADDSGGGGDLLAPDGPDRRQLVGGRRRLAGQALRRDGDDQSVPPLHADGARGHLLRAPWRQLAARPEADRSTCWLLRSLDRHPADLGASPLFPIQLLPPPVILCPRRRFARTIHCLASSSSSSPSSWRTPQTAMTRSNGTVHQL